MLPYLSTLCLAEQRQTRRDEQTLMMLWLTNLWQVSVTRREILFVLELDSWRYIALQNEDTSDSSFVIKLSCHSSSLTTSSSKVEFWRTNSQATSYQLCMRAIHWRISLSQVFLIWKQGTMHNSIDLAGVSHSAFDLVKYLQLNHVVSN